jgi:hypothetical protein
VKVKVNAIYRYNPVLLDRIDGRTNLQEGDLVRVVNLPGCPRANTMGHCHVADPNTGRFIGLVCCNSLEPVTRRIHRIRAINIAKAILAGVDAGDFSLTVARDAMDSIAICPEVVRVEETR